MSPVSATFFILVVCAANQCRSPALLSVLYQGAGGYPGLADGTVSISSVGISHEEGVPTDPGTRKALHRAGYSTSDGLSQRITREMIASSDLILTASRRHRTHVVRMVPDALPRTYTAREFARYCSVMLTEPAPATVLTPAGRLEAALLLAQQQRGMSFPSRVDDDDIPDPAGGSRRVQSRVVRIIIDTITPILAVASRDLGPVRREGIRARR